MVRSFPDITFTGDSYVELLGKDNFTDYDAELIIASLGKYFNENIVLAQNEFEAGRYQSAYLQVDSHRVEYWMEKLKKITSKKTVGICWRSGLQTKLRYVQYMKAEQIVEVFANIDCSVV